MLYRFRSLLVSLSILATLVLTIPAVRADEHVTRAAELVRSRHYAEAYTLAAQSAESPQRSFLLGALALRLDKPGEALPLLQQAELKLPLLGDYAALYQAEALLKLKRYPEAAAKATTIPTSYPQSRLLRRSAKLAADIAFEARDFKGALVALQSFVVKYPTGTDSVDALYQAGRCREELGDSAGARQTYKNIWINNPVTPQALQAEQRFMALDVPGGSIRSASLEDLLKRASFQFERGKFSESLKTLDTARSVATSPAAENRIDMRTGMAQYRLRKTALAETYLARAANSSEKSISSEARFWLAKTLDREGHDQQALKLFLELAAEGKQQSFADDALMEAAGLQRSLGKYADAAQLFEQLGSRYPDSRFFGKSVWESGWSRYLSGDYSAAATILKTLLKDEIQREKALYWLGRSLENAHSSEAAPYYQLLLDEFPTGFYAVWHRDRKGLKDIREGIGQSTAVSPLPVGAGFEKPRLLASLGLLDEARAEMSALRKKSGDKKSLFPALARTYLEMGDFSSSIALFMNNRPVTWEKGTLPLWSAGYPRAYSGLIEQHAAANGLSEGLVYALIRAESGFSPAVMSPAGAIGLMQMMPATAKQTAREKGKFDPQRLTLPEYNITLGTRHLRDLMKGYNGDVVYVAAAYNAGSGALERWRKNLKGLQKDEFIESIPYQETRDYVKKVYASAATYRQLYGIK
jgi:soluble lytic murein transglycosylase